MKNLVALLAFTALTISPISSVNSEIYRWVDEDGKVHFGDRKPPKQAVEDLTDQLGTVNLTESQSPGEYGEFIPETPEEKAVEDQKKRDKKKEYARRQQDCAHARSNLKKLQGRVVLVDDEGQLHEFSEEERAQREARLKKAIKKFCK